MLKIVSGADNFQNVRISAKASVIGVNGRVQILFVP